MDNLDVGVHSSGNFDAKIGYKTPVDADGDWLKFGFEPYANGGAFADAILDVPFVKFKAKFQLSVTEVKPYKF